MSTGLRCHVPTRPRIRHTSCQVPVCQPTHSLHHLTMMPLGFRLSFGHICLDRRRSLPSIVTCTAHTSEIRRGAPPSLKGDGAIPPSPSLTCYALSQANNFDVDQLFSIWLTSASLFSWSSILLNMNALVPASLIEQPTCQHSSLSSTTNRS